MDKVERQDGGVRYCWQSIVPKLGDSRPFARYGINTQIRHISLNDIVVYFWLYGHILQVGVFAHSKAFIDVSQGSE